MRTIYALISAFLVLGCAARQVEKPVHADFDAGGRPCKFSEWRKVIVVSCDPPTRPWDGDVEVFPPIAAPAEHEEGTMLSVFQDLLDLKILQPTLIEGSGLTLFGGGGG